MITFGLILGGFIFLFAGGEALVRGSVSAARKFGLSELVIGLTIVGFGTSLPEMVTSLEALDEGAVGLSIGNVIGSNIANILLVLGAAAFIRRIVTEPQSLAREGVAMLAITCLFVAAIILDLFVYRLTGFVFVALLAAYLVLSVWLDKSAGGGTVATHVVEAESIDANDPLPLALTLIIGGIIGVVGGAWMLVEGGTTAARALGVSETVIGISIIAFGTSLPELVTSMLAARRGKADVALGNILGSNVFNILGIVGVSTLVYPFTLMGEGAVVGYANFAAEAASSVSIVSLLDIIMLFLSIFLIGLFVFIGKSIARWEGAVLLIVYGAYIALRFDLVPGLL